MRKNLALVSVLFAVLVLAVGCKNKPPDIPTKPAGPGSLSRDSTASYLTVTTDPNRDQVLYIFDWADDGYDTTDFSASGDTVSVGHAWTDTGFYAVRARAKDSRGLLSIAWSDTHLVHVTVGSSVNNPPDPPETPTGPDTGWVNEYQAFSTSATDPDGDSVRIQFIWGEDGRTSYWGALAPSGTGVTDSVTYFKRGVKYVRAVAMDKDSAVSDTSPPKVFFANKTNTAPGKPTLTGPNRGIKNGPHYRFYGNAWDPDGDNVQYKFFWGDGGSSDWTSFNPHGIPVMDSWRYSAEGTFSLRVIARDQFGAVSETSDVKTFQVVGEGTVIWGILFGDEIVSSPALAPVLNSRGETRPSVVIGITNGYLAAIDAYQAEILYQTGEEDFEPFNCSPAIGADGTVFIGNENGAVYAYNTAGQMKWQFPDTLSGDDMGGTPAIDGNHIYVGGENWHIQQLRDDGTGAVEVWSYPLREELNASPVLGPSGNLIVCDDSGYVYSFAPDHSVNWVFNTHGNITCSPAIGSDGTVYVGTEQSKMYAITANGSQAWPPYEIIPPTSIISSPVIGADGSIYFGADDGAMYRLGATGQPVPNWPVELTLSDVSSTPALCADGIIYVAAENDTMYAVRENGTVAWSVALQVPVPGKRNPGQRRFGVDDLLPSPVIDQYGIIYIASGYDGVFAIAGRATGTLAQTAWPMFHHDIHHTGKSGAW